MNTGLVNIKNVRGMWLQEIHRDNPSLVFESG